MIKSNSDHVLRSSTSSAAVKLATMVMANSSGNLILSACKRNNLCTCIDNENHNLNSHCVNSQIRTTNQPVCEDDFGKQNCTEHLKNESTKKCKLILNTKPMQEGQNKDQSNNQNNQNQNSRNNQNQNSQSGQNNQDQNNNEALYNQNNEINNQQQNNDQDNNENNDNQINLNQFQIANQMVDINNNIIEPELMLVDENNNLVGLPDANFDLNNNYLWNNQNNLEQQRRQNNHQQNGSNDQQQQNHSQNQQSASEPTNQQSQMNNLSKDNLNCNLASNFTNSNCCKSTQSVQIKQRKKLLELNLNQDLSKPRTSSQYYSSMNEEENVIKEEQEEKCDSTNSNHSVFKRSGSSGRRKKSLQCKKCLPKHLNSNKCEHYHSMDCTTTPEAINESKKNFKKATTPITLCPTPTIKEEKIVITGDSSMMESDLKQPTNKSNLETKALHSAQCPICLFTLSEPCKPNNCAHSFCELCVLEWAKISNECPLCRKSFEFLLNTNGKLIECSINLQAELDNSLESQSSLENILNFDDLNWPFIASSFLNQTSQGNLIDQQHCEQINSILNSVFGHLEPQNMSDLQWPF